RSHRCDAGWHPRCHAAGQQRSPRGHGGGLRTFGKRWPVLKRHFREVSVAAALGAWLLFLAIAAPSFYQPQPLLSLVTREAPTLVPSQWTLILIALALLVLIALAMRHLAAGRFIYAVGSDSEAARLAGIRPRLVTFATFVLMGALVGLAAMMNVAQSPQVDPK